MSTIDATVFDELKQMSGEDFINELIDAFLEEGPNMLTNLQTAYEAKDIETFRRNAHSLKSNANTFGATEMANQAKELEYMSRENNLDIGDRLEKLKYAFSAAATELKEMRV